MIPAILIILLLILLISYLCYRKAFYAPKGRPIGAEEYPIPEGEIYEPHRETMTRWMKEIRTLPHRDVSIRSFDGLTLHGKYYEYAPGAPMELMFHGYRGSSERDLCGGVQRCFALGRNVLIVDQRTSYPSEGHVISFGINEHRDCLSWIDYCIETFGDDVKIILTGISMGASTIMMAAGTPLPKNVVGGLADCGYTSAKAIIEIVIRQMHLPPKLAYPFVWLGARLFGRFNLEETSPLEAMQTCTIPMIFVHGEADDFVPCSMSAESHAACIAPKTLLIVPNAGHGLSYILAPDQYLQTLAEFSNQYMVPTQIQPVPPIPL